MAKDVHAAGEACCQTCEQFAGREPPPARDVPPLRLRPDEAIVRVQQGTGAWREERPGKSEVVFGRSDRTADVVLQDATISRQQFRLRFLADGVEVEDLNSACGTYVDGQRVQRAWLPEGGVIAVGDFVVRVERA